LPETEFYTRLKSDDYKEKAYDEFALVKQLQVTGFPTTLLQVNENKFYMLAKGYTNYDSLRKNVDRCLQEIEAGDGN